MRPWPRGLVLWLGLLAPALGLSALSVQDDLGREVVLAAPAERIVSLAPHVTELLFAAGAGDAVVAVVSFSNYPPQAVELPQVGGYQDLDLEAILALRPDLIVAWKSGNTDAQVERLVDLGMPVFFSEPRSLEHIPTNLERLGRLAGSEAAAAKAARTFRVEYAELRAAYAQAEPVTVFYQIWYQPLMTINGEHLISDVIRLCGGRNVFAELFGLAPQVGVESVLAHDPQAIVASGMAYERPEWVDQWRDWPQLEAVQGNHLYFVPPDLIQRHTPRILQGARILCEQLQRVRGGVDEREKRLPR